MGKVPLSMPFSIEANKTLFPVLLKKVCYGCHGVIQFEKMIMVEKGAKYKYVCETCTTSISEAVFICMGKKPNIIPPPQWSDKTRRALIELMNL